MAKWIILATVLLILMLPAVAQAAPPDGAEVYVVQADDRLGRLADKFYGSPRAAPLIVAATNAQAEIDDGYSRIDNPEALVVGQKLVAPPAEDVTLALQKINESQGGPSPGQAQLLAEMRVLGQPPELHNEVWLNSEPLKLSDLRGQVVIVEFWTYG